ncbi:MAG TPA: DUF47 family protein [Polyangia bacterium]
MQGLRQNDRRSNGIAWSRPAIKQIAHECDEITHAVVSALHKTFITPIDRNDIYKLLWS